MITVKANGIEYKGFIEINVSKSLDEAAAQFTATISSQYSYINKVRTPIKVGDAIEILIDSFVALTGFVDRIDSSFSAASHIITIQGRDKTSDLIDSTISDDISISTPVTLVKLAEKVISSIHSDIPVISYIEDITFDAGDIVTAEVGESAYSFIEAHCQKKQVIATTDGLGNLVFTRADTSNTASVMLLNQQNGTQNNIVNASFFIDHTQRFHSYTILSQGNAVGEINLNLDVANPANAAARSYTLTDKDIRGSRTYNGLAAKSSTQGECKPECEWNANIKRARSFSYTATVAGHSMSPTSDIWRPNTIVHVIDDFADINTNLLIGDVTFRYSLDGGAETDITCVSADSYTLEPVEKKVTSTNSDVDKQLEAYIKQNTS